MCKNRYLKYIQHLHNNHSKEDLFNYKYLLEIKMEDKKILPKYKYQFYYFNGGAW